MIVKEYLKNQKAVSLTFIANEMWPKNKSSLTYLSRKLHDDPKRPWTVADEEKAKGILNALGIELTNL